MLPSRTCALIVIAFSVRTTFGESLLGMERGSVAGGVRLVAASMIEGLGTRSWSYKTERTTGKQTFSGSCDTTGNVRKLDQRAEGLDKPAEGWRQSSWDNCHRFVGVKFQRDVGRAQEVHFRRHSRSSESWRSAPGKKVTERGKAQVHGRYPGSCHLGRCGWAHATST